MSRSEHKAQRRLSKRQRAAMFHVQANGFTQTLGKAGGLSSDGRVFVACSKVKYPWKSTAEQAARVMSRKTGGTLNAYWCRRCRAWHVGNRRHLSASD